MWPLPCASWTASRCRRATPICRATSAGPHSRCRARCAHIERVVALLATWAAALRAPEAERARWVKAAWLHDALRDAPAAGELAHGPMAAERAARDGESDRGVLDAVRYHSLGYVSW